MIRISTSINAPVFRFLYLMLHLCLLQSSAETAHILSSNQRIKDGESTLVSANSMFELGFFGYYNTSGDEKDRRYVGIWYHQSPNINVSNEIIWVANRENPLDNKDGSFSVGADGNLVVSNGIGNIVWSTNTSAPRNSTSVAVLENNGNLVLREEASSGAVLWESFDDPCDTLLPGMKIGVNLKNGRSRMLRAWTSWDDPSPGIYSFGIDPQDPNQFFIWRGSLPYWRVIFWNGSTFKIVVLLPLMYDEMRTSTTPLDESWGLNTSVLRAHDAPFLSPSHGLFEQMQLEPDGLLSICCFFYNGTKWLLVSVKPEERQCSTGVCGPNSSCNEKEEPVCKCLPGYKPLYPANWNSGKREGGCIEVPEQLCDATKENHYLTLNRVMLGGGSSGWLVSEKLTSGTCGQHCDSLDCDCKAYAGLVDPCYIWHGAEQLTDLEEDVEDGRSESVLAQLNIRIASSVLSSRGRRCGFCGTNVIPYPLSTGPDCGDPAYNSFHCNSSNGQLSFVTPDGSSYSVSGINPENRTFFIKPGGLDLCWAGSSKRNDIHLDSSSRFHVTIYNTVLLFNCSSTPQKQVPLNCGSSNPCYSYIQEGRAPCFYAAKCCSYIAGDSNSSTLHGIGILDSGCGSYASIVNLDTTVDIYLWTERVQIEWDPPPEPVCDAEDDCDAWSYSSCLASPADAGRKRCLCYDSFRWDPFLMICSYYGDGSRSGRTKQLNGTKQRDGDRSRFIENKRLFVSLISTGVLGTILSSAVIYCLWRKKRIKGRRKIWSFYDESTDVVNMNENLDVPFIDFECLVEATDNFSNSNKLGKGGFGVVYKGTHPGGQEIAVKRLSKGSGQGLEEFKNEVVLIAKLQHRNLVRMLGYCIQGSEKILVYEYMPNKSLDLFLFEAARRSVLDWEKRSNIIMGITRGLLYLHQDSRLRIIHRDLKTSNILLDKDMNPKISDFGMARMFGGDQIQENTDRVVGTYGYISPEYAANGLYSVKSDVYSFGIIILEIISGKRNSDFAQDENASSLTAYAWQRWKEERGLELMDPSLRETCNEGQVLKCIHVGLLCVQDNASDRPRMSSVLAMLDSESPSLPPPNQPAFFRGRFPPPPTSSSDGMPIYSDNEVTITTLDAR